MQKTLGGDRLGAGKKMKVNLHGYERSTHDLSYVWRSTMSPGTLVPFISEVGLPGDTFDINLELYINTHPTIGPLFGSKKAQLDIFVAPVRLYNSLLHNNALGIGLQMSQVKLPQIQLNSEPAPADINDIPDIDNYQIHPSCILNYLGIRGIGINQDATTKTRDFNAIPILAYWEIYKQYYSNKVEEIGAVIHTPAVALVTTVDDIQVFIPPGTTNTIPQVPSSSPSTLLSGSMLIINYTPPAAAPLPEQIMVNTLEHGVLSMAQLAATPFISGGVGILTTPFRWTYYGDTTVTSWDYADLSDLNNGKPAVVTFDLQDIDQMRKDILAYNSTVSPYRIVDGVTTTEPYRWLVEAPNGVPNILSNQEGLGLKTYQSDLFNNWLNTEWIDGAGGITDITSIDTTGGSFSIDTLNLSKKVYDMLNRIAVSGGSYDDWVSTVYDHEPYNRCESPMYMGGLIQEIVFQEVISNSQSENQPLGTLAGKGTLSQNQKGGHIVLKIDEPSYIIGIVSITPRIDYSQGNKWDIHLQTLDDLHKPALDEIGFQELQTEQMAWWDTNWDTVTSTWLTKSAGKQPAWLNYMTNVNRTYGNFAINDNEMFMTLNRRYELDEGTPTSANIKDLTTYIDPSKFNFIFAETSLDAQNYWAQIGVNMIARRKMSAKLMPNL